MSIFFKPKKPFLKWLKDFVGNSIVYDIGCGECHLLRLLMQMKIKALGIDPYPLGLPETLEPSPAVHGLAVLPLMAQQASTLREHPGVAIFARPCHDGFVEETIELLHKDTRILYISKPTNIAVDLDLDRYLVKPVRHNCGEDRECAYLVRRRTDL